ncbi:hypothetical protein EDD63_16211 [Breznakia blatticola]|uniref:Uncharacterized protein n=1 Tax=Breznakia blatticola TaxID=1754012 RepID=A0A4R7ZFG9_9FIRM|nr:hypothetical protein [Breznakia blatticola]TDW09198.1 hypothetical protein EDD63_16211 [Breznakia blatticola]
MNVLMSDAIGTSKRIEFSEEKIDYTVKMFRYLERYRKYRNDHEKFINDFLSGYNGAAKKQISEYSQPVLKQIELLELNCTFLYNELLEMIRSFMQFDEMLALKITQRFLNEGMMSESDLGTTSDGQPITSDMIANAIKAQEEQRGDS